MATDAATSCRYDPGREVQRRSKIERELSTRRDLHDARHRTHHALCQRLARLASHRRHVRTRLDVIRDSGPGTRPHLHGESRSVCAERHAHGIRLNLLGAARAQGLGLARNRANEGDEGQLIDVRPYGLYAEANGRRTVRPGVPRRGRAPGDDAPLGHVDVLALVLWPDVVARLLT